MTAQPFPEPNDYEVDEEVDDLSEQQLEYVESLTRDLLRLKKTKEDLTEEILDVEEQLDQALEKRAIVRIGQARFKVTPVRSVSTTVDQQVFAENHPDLYEQCSEEQPRKIIADKVAEAMRAGELTHEQAREFIRSKPKKTSIRLTQMAEPTHQED